MKNDHGHPTRRQLLGGASVLAAATMVATAKAQDDTAKQTQKIDVAGKSVLITGTSSGFGKLTSLHLAREGALVIASMRHFKKGKRPEAQELADIAAKEKLNLHLVEIDVDDDALVAEGAAKAQEIAGGALDVLVNNAGIAMGGPVEFNDEIAVARQVDTNLFGSHRMARAVLPAMRQRGQGSIIQISSQLGRIVLPMIGVYGASKFAVEGMFEAMAYELAPHGVDVTIVQPGGYPTKIWENGRRYMAELMEREGREREEAYAAHLQISQNMFGGLPPTDPMDIPRAIAEIISMPNGGRPLRRPVHPNTVGTDTANATMAKIQEATLTRPGSPFADWHAYVTKQG